MKLSSVFSSRWVKLSAGALGLGLALGPMTAAAEAGNRKLDFGIVDGQVIPAEDFAIKVTVLGAALTANGVDLPVTVKVQVHSEHMEPFGPAGSPLSGNVNDHQNPRSHIVHRGWASHLPVTITGTSWTTHDGASGAEDGDYHSLHNRNSNGQHPYVKVLRHGDPVPDLAGYDGQTSIAGFVQDYVDLNTDTMVLDENAAIYLFELGVEDLDSAAADFQDLVVLVNLGRSVEELLEQDDLAALYD